jgi:hypothetical protein
MTATATVTNIIKVIIATVGIGIVGIIAGMTATMIVIATTATTGIKPAGQRTE